MDITAQFVKFALLGSSWVLYLLLACNIVSIAVMFERFFFYRRYKCNFEIFIQELNAKLTESENYDLITVWCSAQNSFESKVAMSGLQKQAKLSIRAVEENMRITAILAKKELEKGTTLLSTLANNTPFIGLFGTVLGIIQAFHALSVNKQAGPELVMSSISEALVATAVGIFVAIPAVIAYNILLKGIKNKMSNFEAINKLITSTFSSKDIGE